MACRFQYKSHTPNRRKDSLMYVRRRMSWMSQRKTTRNEDLAYCVLGLFDVNMPLIYVCSLMHFFYGSSPSNFANGGANQIACSNNRARATKRLCDFKPRSSDNPTTSRSSHGLRRILAQRFGHSLKVHSTICWQHRL